MKPILRHTIATVAVAAFCVVTMLIMRLSETQRRELTCVALDTQITDSLGFVTVKDIESCLETHYGQYIGQRLDEIELSRIEKILVSRSAVSKCEAWTTDDGILHISIKQRIPALRFQNGDKGFYVDESGFIFPLDANYTAPVTVIKGNIPMLSQDGDHSWLDKVMAMLRFIQKSRKWAGFWSSISVADNGDFILFPAEGKERFIFGKPDDFAQKFAKIERYYSTIKPNKEENYYKSVNVKFNGQIICRKDL